MDRVIKQDINAENTKVNRPVEIRSAYPNIEFLYKKEVVLKFNNDTLELRDLSYQYYKKYGYNSDLAYWANQFRISILNEIK